MYFYPCIKKCFLCIYLFVKEYESYEALQKNDLHTLNLTVKKPVHYCKPSALEKRTRF